MNSYALGAETGSSFNRRSSTASFGGHLSGGRLIGICGGGLGENIRAVVE